MSYTAEDYITFIEAGRRDKISPDALALIAKRFRELEAQKPVAIEHNKQKRAMDKTDVRELLFTIYGAGFTHGSNEGYFPKHSIIGAFNRCIVGESPLEDTLSYTIKAKVDEMLSRF